jgi:hypothetical protein
VIYDDVLEDKYIRMTVYIWLYFCLCGCIIVVILLVCHMFLLA